MKTESGRPRARQYLDNLAASSRYTFTTGEARTALGLSPPALKMALNRLTRQRLIVSPVRGFHVIVPPEYRSLGSLPAGQFVPALMTTLKLPYYAGLLTAAEYHGAAHQRPQEFQVLVEKARRRIECGKVRVGFFVRKNLRRVPAQTLNTPRGFIVVSTPEATAFDLVGYRHRAGGLSNVATVLSELAEKIDPERLVKAAPAAPGSVGAKAGLPSGAGRSRWQDGTASAVRGRTRARICPAPSGRAARQVEPPGHMEAVFERGSGVRSVIPRDHILEWRAQAPWPQDSQVERNRVRDDLVEKLLPELDRAVPQRGRGGRQGATVGQLDRPGHVADGHEPADWSRGPFIVPESGWTLQFSQLTMPGQIRCTIREPIVDGERPMPAIIGLWNPRAS